MQELSQVCKRATGEQVMENVDLGSGLHSDDIIGGKSGSIQERIIRRDPASLGVTGVSLE
jgi:hypothetical protein